MKLDDVRDICLTLPHTKEDIKWEDNLCFLVAEKIFCLANLEPPHSTSFKVTEENFAELVENEGYRKAPYFAKNQWVMTEDISSIKKSEIKKYIEQSYKLIHSKLPKKIQQNLNES